ncbi:MAG TPA: enoyl-CoA hydratase-related protein [Gemmatimonadaceae bacterium]|nr:enoyl-CoA hydratase-related protein [Gemmatimonadaceae bacterium]
MTAAAAPTSTFVRVAIAGGVARVILDRPHVNVLTIAMLEELDAALATAAREPGVKLVLLAGAGKCFCAGVDVAEHGPTKVHQMLTTFHHAIRTLLSLEVPVIAAVHSAALGGGMELALACDLVLAADDLRMGQPEIGLGVFPPAAAAILPRLIGRQRAMDLILTGRTVTAAEALSRGLVSAVFPAGEFAHRVHEYTAQLTALSGPVLKLAKRAVLAGLEVPPGEAIARAERIYLDDLMQLPDAHEGIAAWVAKRPPVWAEG